MIGKNQLVLNQASMNEAVQLWINKYLTSQPTVISVEQTGSGYEKEWTIKVEGRGETVGGST